MFMYDGMLQHEIQSDGFLRELQSAAERIAGNGVNCHGTHARAAQSRIAIGHITHCGGLLVMLTLLNVKLLATVLQMKKPY